MYDEAFKQRVVTAVRDRSDDKSITDIANEFNISPRTLYSWLDRQSHYKRRARPRVINPCQGKEHVGNTVPRRRLEELEQENANLRRHLDTLMEALQKAVRP